jgi:transcription elongation factor/antiterminator RfaH
MDDRNEKEPLTQTGPFIDTGSNLWFVVQTKPGDEDRVKTNLLNQEMEAYLPLLKTHRYSGGKLVEKIKPLFPNYLFAKLNVEHHYYRVKWTRGVNKILGNGRGPVPISARVIEAIKDREGGNSFVTLEEDLRDGDEIRVTSGPLKDLLGIFKSNMSSKGRVRVLLSLIGVDVPVQISRWQIKKIT